MRGNHWYTIASIASIVVSIHCVIWNTWKLNTKKKLFQVISKIVNLQLAIFETGIKVPEEEISMLIFANYTVLFCI